MSITGLHYLGYRGLKSSADGCGEEGRETA